jgi:hypothetical protein
MKRRTAVLSKDLIKFCENYRLTPALFPKKEGAINKFTTYLPLTYWEIICNTTDKLWEVCWSDEYSIK